MYSLIRFIVMLILFVWMAHLLLQEFIPGGKFVNAECLLGGFMSMVVCMLAEIKEAIKEKK